jgi:putative quorum-sensing-regulated virulence factor
MKKAGQMKTFPFGKHKGLPLSEVPEDYLEWYLRTTKEQITTIEEELQRRELADLATGTWKEKLIKAGYRTLMKQYHPDSGGTTSDAQQVNAAFEALKRQW